MFTKYLKVFGVLLLVLGVGIIIWTLVFSYNIFTGETETPVYFDIKQEEVLSPTDNNELDVEKLMEEQISAIISTDDIREMFNLVVWSILAFILIFGGSQLASIGIKIIKNEK